MAVSIPELPIYHVDSFSEEFLVPDRQSRIWVVLSFKTCYFHLSKYLICYDLKLSRLYFFQASVLFDIMNSDYHEPHSLHTPHNLGNWPILEARGIPNCETRYTRVFNLLTYICKFSLNVRIYLLFDKYCGIFV